MKKYFWLIAVAVAGVAFWLINRKQSPDRSQGAVINTNTATRPLDIWEGWGTVAETAISNTTATVYNARNSIDSLSNGVISLFGGQSVATGARTPVTSGNGAGVPQ